MPRIEPVWWKLGKRLMPHLLPCSAVILFVRISEFCFSYYFPILDSSFRSHPQEVYLRITGASSRGERQGFPDDFHPCCKISPKQRMTFPVAPGCRTSRRKPDRVVLRKNSYKIDITGIFAHRGNAVKKERGSPGYKGWNGIRSKTAPVLYRNPVTLDPQTARLRKACASNVHFCGQNT